MLFCCTIVLDSTRGRGGEGGKKNPLFVLNFARAIVLSNKSLLSRCRWAEMLQGDYNLLKLSPKNKILLILFSKKCEQQRCKYRTRKPCMKHKDDVKCF